MTTFPGHWIAPEEHATGDVSMLLDDDPHTYPFTRTLEDQQLLVLGKFSGSHQTTQIGPGWDDSTPVIGNYNQTPGAAGHQIELRPWEAIVLRRTLH